MNFIQKNPNDPKYAEFHDGEYEYWPSDGSLNSKSTAFPTALLNGLNMLAATAAAAILVLALSLLYVISAPLAITEHSARINVNVYNNEENQHIDYTLALFSDPETILQEGSLTNDEDILLLRDLSGGTTYLLRYFDADRQQVGKFRFTTPGQLPSPGDPDDPLPPDPTAETGTPSTQPTDGTEETEPATEGETEPTESTTEHTPARLG